MAFLGVLPESPSLGTQIARELQVGLGSGISKASQFAQQMAIERYKQNLRQNLIKSIEEPGTKIKSVGEQLVPEKETKIDPFGKAKSYAVAGEHELAKLETERAKSTEKERMQKEKEEREILSIQPKEFLSSVESYRKGSRDIDIALQAELDAISRGEVDPFSSGHVAEMIKQFGLPPTLAAPFETVGSKEFRTGQKTFLAKTFKDAFRGATTQGQVELASSMLAEAGASKEGNLASLFLLQSQHLIEQEKIRLTDEAIEKGVSAYKLPQYVNKQLDKYAKDINRSYFDSLEQLRKHGADAFIGAQK